MKEIQQCKNAGVVQCFSTSGKQKKKKREVYGFLRFKSFFPDKGDGQKGSLKKKKEERVENIGDNLQVGIIFGVGSFGRTGLFSLG